jgi:hypothetical protein
VGQQAISKLEHCKKISAKKFEKIIIAFNFSVEEIESEKKYLPPPPPIALNKALYFRTTQSEAISVWEIFLLLIILHLSLKG